MLCNITCMFREAHALRQSTALPDLVARARSGHPVKMWSAGCSTGEECYSLAIMLLELCPEAASLDIRILGVDVDPPNIRAAKDGLRAWSELSPLIDFQEGDLLGDWPDDGPFDLIMCCSVAYHLDQPSRARLWSRLTEALVPGGYLFVGHIDQGWRGEMLEAGRGQLDLIRPTEFKRTVL